MKRSVLIVEDNSINRTMLAAILQKRYNVIQSTNGKEAMQILKEQGHAISAVLLDINMPVMDGYQVLSLMKSDESLRSIPVLVATGEIDVDAEEKALSLGANDFFLKPYKPSIINLSLENTIALCESSALINEVTYDELTGLLSPAFFFKRAQGMLDQSEGDLVLACCVADHMELINELYGTSMESAVIKRIGEALSSIADNDTILGRIGHDRFAGIGPMINLDPDKLGELENEVNSDGLSLRIRLCHGRYLINRSMGSPIRVLCDRALLAADSIRGDRTCSLAVYDESFTKRLLREQFLVNSMASSIKEKQFQVHYQPKNDLKTGKVIGAEALVRWISPERGLISPLEFIPLFERNGLITQLDQYVWEQVCKDLREWKNKGIDIPHVSVNVSRIDVLNPAIGNVLNKLIGKYGLKHSDLHLEITESAYTYDSQTLVDVVQCLRSQGFILEMDDFGKGFSSLSMLSSLPINILKLDMDLVRSGNLDDRKSVVLGFVISLARELGIPVIAEGVETREQAETPCRMGWDFARGYYYSRPLPRDAFEAYLKGTK